MEKIGGKSRQNQGRKGGKQKKIKNDKNKCDKIKHKKNDLIDAGSNFELLQRTKIEFKRANYKRAKLSDSLHPSVNKVMHADKVNHSRHSTILNILS